MARGKERFSLVRDIVVVAWKANSEGSICDGLKKIDNEGKHRDVGYDLFYIYMFWSFKWSSSLMDSQMGDHDDGWWLHWSSLVLGGEE